LGAYTASRRETGLLIPSDYNNHDGRSGLWRSRMLDDPGLAVRDGGKK